jgi:hypothetical protein
MTGRAAIQSTVNHHHFDSVVYPWPGVGSIKPLVVQGDRVMYQFYSDHSVGSGNGTNLNSRWGYSFVATGKKHLRLHLHFL